MMNNNKILTVSYGTFSCTLEGFDDSFGTMKAIAEYFRDLAADDRYFGAEPAQPDAQMLAHIAQNEISRRVEAREQDGKIVLSAQEETATAQISPAPAAGLAGLASSAAAVQTQEAPSAEAAAPTPAAAAPTPAVATSAAATPDTHAYEEDADTVAPVSRDKTVDIVPSLPDEEVEAFFADSDVTTPSDEAELGYADIGAPSASIADRLSRIRAVVSKQTDDEVEEPADYSEDQHAAADADTDAGFEDMPDVADAADAADAAAEQKDGVLADAMTDIEAAFDADDEAETVAEDTPFEFDDEEAEEETLSDSAEDDSDEADELGALLGRLDEAETQELEEAASEATETSHANELRSEDINLHAMIDDAEADVQEDADLSAERDAFLDLMASDDDSDFEDELDEGDTAPLTGEEDAATLADFLADAEAEAAEDEADEDGAAEPFVLTDAVKADDVDEDALALLSTVTDEGEDAEVAGAGENLFDGSDADADAAPHARVLKVKRADLEAAIERGNLEEIEDDEDEAPTPSGSSLSAEDEAELARELAALETELGGSDDTLRADHDDDEGDADIYAQTDDAAEDDDQPIAGRDKLSDINGDESDISRLMEVTENQMGEPESATRRDAFAHLKAAVAAKKADDATGATNDDAASEDEAYRADLADAVRPRRPTIIKSNRTERPDDARPAPLKLVAEQRIDVAKPSTGPVRPRRVAALTGAAAADEDESFVDFAEEVGASELPDLLEAAAAYLSFVEGREQFSRPQLMTKVRQVEKHDFSREDGLRSFGKLLRDGKIQKIRGGRFQASEDIGFKPDTRAAS